MVDRFRVYTSFDYRDLEVKGSETVTATFTVTNAGKRAGADVAQVYLTDAPGERRMRLLGFERVELTPGASRRVTVTADPRLLARVRPAITATVYADEKSSKSEAYVDAVARTNVLHAIGVIRQRSKILADLEKKGALKIVGAMYDITTGVVTFLS
jgi:Fibronectin type III-like domain/Carbonic anhydrase